MGPVKQDSVMRILDSSIPRPYALMGAKGEVLDGPPPSAAVEPPLTTMQVSKAQIGRMAIRDDADVPSSGAV